MLYYDRPDVSEGIDVNKAIFLNECLYIINDIL